MVSHFGVLPLFDVSPLSLFRERRGSGVGQAALCEGGAPKGDSATLGHQWASTPPPTNGAPSQTP